MTRVVKFHEFGGPDVLKIESLTHGELGPGDVQVRMTAIALNRANSLFREGNYLFKATFPSRIGSEGVGIVEAVAPDVTGLEIGQRVNLFRLIARARAVIRRTSISSRKKKYFPRPKDLATARQQPPGYPS